MWKSYSIILVNQHLVSLILSSQRKHISLQFCQPPLSLTLHLFPVQLLSLQPLPFHLLSLLLFKALLESKGFHLLLLLFHLPLLLESVLLQFIFTLLLCNLTLLSGPVGLGWCLGWGVLDDGDFTAGRHGRRI